MTALLHDRVRDALAAGRFPFVYGGDCSDPARHRARPAAHDRPALPRRSRGHHAAGRVRGRRGRQHRDRPAAGPDRTPAHRPARRLARHAARRSAGRPRSPRRAVAPPVQRRFAARARRLAARRPTRSRRAPRTPAARPSSTCRTPPTAGGCTSTWTCWTRPCSRPRACPDVPDDPGGLTWEQLTAHGVGGAGLRRLRGRQHDHLRPRPGPGRRLRPPHRASRPGDRRGAVRPIRSGGG